MSSHIGFSAPLIDKDKETILNPEMARDGHTDRLSSLPDFVLTEILSLLKAREVIQTCVLSKRWLILWASVPCLKFDISEFIDEENMENSGNSDISEVENEENIENRGRELERFQNFVSMFLHFRDDAIDLDELHVRSDFGIIHSVYVTTWTLYAAKHNVKSLNMHFLLHEPIDLPDCLFVCKSLVNLDLNFWWVNDILMKIKPVRICLPKVKSLRFRDAILNGKYMEKILLGCPVLEDLMMTNCSLKMNMNISSQRLNQLMIINCSLISKNIVPTVFKICAPNVECLDFDVYSKHENMMVSFEGMSNVPEAWIIIDFLEDNYSHVLSGLPGLEDLHIICETCLMEMLKAELPKLPKFKNLKNLGLGYCCMICAFGLLASFLNHCPNLENLTLGHDENLCENNEGHGLEENNKNLEQIERFCCERLKTVKVTKDENNFVLKRLSQSTKETVEFLLVDEM